MIQPSPILTEKEYRKRLLRIWLLGFLGLFGILGSLNLWKLIQLTREGMPTPVIVRAIDSDRQQTLHYSYVVEQVSHEGEGTTESPVKVGDSLSGTYQSTDPSNSCLGDPGPQLRHEAGFTLLVALLVPSLVVLRASFRYRKWLKQRKLGTDVNGL